MQRAFGRYAGLSEEEIQRVLGRPAGPSEEEIQRALDAADGPSEDEIQLTQETLESTKLPSDKTKGNLIRKKPKVKKKDTE